MRFYKKWFQAGALEIENVNSSERQSAREHNENRVRDRFPALEEYDAKSKEYYKGWVPDIKLEQAGATTFIHFGDQEVCADYISDIFVASTGNGPFLFTCSISLEISEGSPTPARVTALLCSGREITFSCNRHCVDALYVGLSKAWKEALKKATP